MVPIPECTVVIPCFNGENSLETAVASVVAQTYANWQLVIVDDCSADGSREVARRLATGHRNVRILEMPENHGVCAARNAGVRSTSSRYVSFLDQDDWYEPDFLRVSCHVLDTSPEFDAVAVEPILPAEVDVVRSRVIANSLVNLRVFRRESFEFVGGFPESDIFRTHRGGEDIAFNRMFAGCFNTGKVDAGLYNYSRRPGNALDRFLQRTDVRDGNVVFLDDTSMDHEIMGEVKRLQAQVRAKIRDIVWREIGLPLHRSKRG